MVGRNSEIGSYKGKKKKRAQSCRVQPVTGGQSEHKLTFVLPRGRPRSFEDSQAFARLVCLKFLPSILLLYWQAISCRVPLISLRRGSWSNCHTFATLINTCKMRFHIPEEEEGVGGKRVDEGDGLTSRYMIAFCVMERRCLGSIRTCWHCSWWSVKWGGKRANADIAAEVTLEVNPSALIPVSARRTAVVIIFFKK